MAEREKRWKAFLVDPEWGSNQYRKTSMIRKAKAIWRGQRRFGSDIEMIDEQEARPMSHSRPPLPPFGLETAGQKVRLAEDAWNTRDPERVALAYTDDSRWRNRAEFFQGRKAIVEFLKRKWAKELDYRLIKELWAFHENRISVRFQHEWHDDSGDWFRAHGNEQWAFDANGLMRRREASINDVPIAEKNRLFHWPLGPRPADHKGLSELGL